MSGMDQPCSVCPAGRIAEATGSTNCTACQQGRYLSDDAISPTLHDSASDCTGCEVGTATSSEGQMQCEICGAGRVAVTSGLIECALCMFVLTSALFSPSPVPKAPRPPPPPFPSFRSGEAGRYLKDFATDATMHDQNDDCTR